MAAVTPAAVAMAGNDVGAAAMVVGAPTDEVAAENAVAVVGPATVLLVEVTVPLLLLLLLLLHAVAESTIRAAIVRRVRHLIARPGQ